MKQSNGWIRLISAITAAVVALTPMLPVRAAEPENTVLINEIESNDSDSGKDWIEIINTGDTDADISGWFVTDDAGLDRVADGTAAPIASGTVLSPGAVLVLEEDTDFGFGLGKADTVTLYNADTQAVDTYSWTAHAAGTYSRVPGTSEFVDQPATKGAPNIPAPEPEEPDDKPEITDSPVVINEVESNGDETDWVEIYNTGDTAVDISGWYLLDNNPVDHAAEVTPVAAGTSLEPGAFFVFDQNVHFTFGLGSADQVTILDQDGRVVAEFAWTAHAAVVYARVPDGVGELAEFDTATKGAPNMRKNPVVISEVQSNDPDGGPDWIELANPTDAELDISGIVVKDSDDAHAYEISAGTVIPAGGYLVITEEAFGFGLGKGDAVRLFQNGVLLAGTTWEGHTDPTWGLYPDAHGAEYRSTAEATPGEANKFPEPPHTHDYTAVVTDPTCGEEGYTTYTCFICGDTYRDNITPPTGKHTYQDDADTTCDVCSYVRVIEAEEPETVPMYRLYNPYTQEHLLTRSNAEKILLVSAGWNYDGIAWNVPAAGDPVYRLYNPYDDFHFYTMSLEEVDSLTPLGWKVDGVVCASASEKDGIPIYRLFNPYEPKCYHLYTASVEERDWLVSLGWQLEGVAWYAVP